ncbi:MAG: Gfo/Idh/MocA family protein [Planctomycetota bacterium]
MTCRPGTLSRRQFARTAAQLGAALTLPQFIPGTSLGMNGAVAPSGRITLGGIGLGHRGSIDLRAFLEQPDIRFVAIADVQRGRRETIKAIVDEKYGNQDCRTYRDLRELLAQSDIDAVLVATSDRWHTMASILAAKAGKDIYCEKPCSISIAESIELADCVRRYGRVFQAGMQRRTVDNFVFAVELAQHGKLGKLHTVHANTLDPATSHIWLPAEPQPPQEEVDWDLWLGPVPWRPFNSAYLTAGGWRHFFDFHGGGILEWGVHTVDLCQWANQADETGPVEFEPRGTEVHAVYANGVKLVMRDTGWMGLGSCCIRFEGDDGWVETGDSRTVALSPHLRPKLRTFVDRGTPPLNHIRNFIECVKTRGVPSTNEDIARQSHNACHAAYIAWQLGRTLQFDPVKHEFLGDEEANRMRSRAYREPWHI